MIEIILEITTIEIEAKIITKIIIIIEIIINNNNGNNNRRFGKRPLDEKGIEKNIKNIMSRNYRKRAK